MLTNCKTFDEVIELTKSGNNSKVDMLVGDIYGGEYGKVGKTGLDEDPGLKQGMISNAYFSLAGLDASVIAASFGKVVMKKEAPDVYGWAGMWKQFVRAIKGSSYLWLNFLLSTPVLGPLLRWYAIIGTFDSRFHELLAAKTGSTVGFYSVRPQDGVRQENTGETGKLGP